MTDLERRTRILAALPVEWASCLSELGLSPEQTDDTHKMIFQMAFLRGAKWQADLVLAEQREIRELREGGNLFGIFDAARKLKGLP